MASSLPGIAAPFIQVGSTRGVALSTRDELLTRQALYDASRGKWNDGKAEIALTHDRLAQDLYFWLYYVKDAGIVDFRHVAAILQNHPDWPRQGSLRIIAEKAMPPNMSDDDVAAWFDRFPPKTFDGLGRYLAALQREGRTDKISKTVGDWWRTASLTPDEQARLYNSYGRYIAPHDNLVRLNGQLTAGAYANARIIARMIGHGYPSLVEARIALAQDQPGADGMVDSVPSDLQRDPGLLYERLHWRRVHNYDVGAMEMLHNAPPSDTIPNLEDWYTERQILARRLMAQGQYQSAYLLVADHIEDNGQAVTQAEFLAGWLALEYLKDPWKAFQHFEALYKESDTPNSRSRAAYWAGRASDALNHPEIGRKWYQVASKSQTAFYGQLAIGRLSNEYKPPQEMPPQRTVAGQNAFNRLDMVQAARLLHQAGFRNETSEFLNALSDSVTTPEQYLYVAELSRDLDHLSNAVRIARKGLQKGIFLMDAAFPTILKDMRGVTVEWALVHGIIRQESSFDYTALSPVGARGLMQLMPGTADMMARKLGLPQRVDELTTDPNYNIRLGSAYLQMLLNKYNGSYPLAVAAYNGGPGRVDGWLRQYGDPRAGQIDIVDWIELIPITETRNYVQRVLEGVYIYRIKLRDVQKSYSGPMTDSFDR
jgi:soluble lytic murein transglycosylase